MTYKFKWKWEVLIPLIGAFLAGLSAFVMDPNFLTNDWSKPEVWVPLLIQTVFRMGVGAAIATIFRTGKNVDPDDSPDDGDPGVGRQPLVSPPPIPTGRTYRGGP